MNQIVKGATLQSGSIDDAELKLINRQTMRPMTAEELFTFRLAACNNVVDRDFERFTEETLQELANLYVGRPVLMDHKWSAALQTARVYAADVEPDGDCKRLILRCYMPRTDDTASTITSIESGILKECSVGCSVRHAKCSICGADQTEQLCKHIPGREYDGALCHMDLSGAADAYEVSLVPVPAQPGAGIIKSKRYGGVEASGKTPPPDPARGADPDTDDWADAAALELEKNRYFMEV